MPSLRFTMRPGRPERRIRVAVVGRGAIAAAVADAAGDGSLPGVDLVGMVGRAVSGPLSFDGQRLLALDADWVVEAAGVQAAADLVPFAVEHGLRVVLMSIGALASESVADSVERYRAVGGVVIEPSGAIGGLDIVRALAVTGGLQRVELTTTKAPKAFEGAPYLEWQSLALPADRAVTVFEGSARDAIRGFPANANVAVALARAGLGLDETRVVLRSDPEARRTTHRVSAAGELGSVDVKVTSQPDPDQPRTSRLAALSLIATLNAIGLGEISTPHSCIAARPSDRGHGRGMA
jgi:aspartate dehydrogenase